MSRVTCRCGEVLEVPSGGPARIDCPRCGARIRLRRHSASPAGLRGILETEDGYIRFLCPCGRRLKVKAENRPEAGKCPDCGRIVPVPELAWPAPAPAEGPARSDPDARTEDLDETDLARLQAWSTRHQGRSSSSRPEGRDDTTPAVIPAVTGSDFGQGSAGAPPSSMVKFEAGLRVCPRCGKPVHLSATTCRECGSPVPRR
jgi:hypothetical protein